MFEFGRAFFNFFLSIIFYVSTKKYGVNYESLILQGDSLKNGKWFSFVLNPSYGTERYYS